MRSFRFVSLLLRRSREEAGVSLVEVLVCGVLLIVAGGGLLSAIDAAGNQSNEQRHQAIAADLAQAEMERLTGLRFTDVETLNASQTKTVGGTVYTVASAATWALQTPTGAANCSASGRSPEALKLTTTVTWPKMSRKPVTMTSMRAAPTSASTGKGNFVVQLTDRNGNGVPGVGIAMNGATPMSGTTDADGCIRFNEMDAGTYTLSFDGGGKITREGLASVSESQDVVAGQTRSAIYEIDTPGTLTVSNYRIKCCNNGTWRNVPAPGELSLTHASLASPIIAAATAAPTTKAGLYPFSSAYGVYADNCSSAAPGASDILNATITPGTTTTAANMQLPGLDIRPSNAAVGDQVYVRTACGTTIGPRLLVNESSAVRLRTGYPYGALEVCVVKLSFNPDKWIKKTVTNDDYDDDKDVVNVNTNGQRFDFNHSSASQSTPTCGWAGFVAS